MSGAMNWAQFAIDTHSVRIRSGKSLPDAAKLLGIGHATLSRAENGMTLDTFTFMRLCEAYDLEPKNYWVREQGE